MGLFDFLSKTPSDDEFGDDVQGTDAPSLAPAKPAARELRAASPEPAKAPAKATPKPTPKSQASDMPDFGIQKAIELMRDLPQQNVELVVQVVKKTLESMEVDVATIIDDAKSKQAKIQGRIKGLEEEIAEFKEEIAAREEEITALKSDFAETRQVRERLEMAQKGISPKSDVVAPPTGRAPTSVAPPGKPSPASDVSKSGN